MERFRREVQVMAQTRHPNVLQIIDYGSLSIQRGEGEVPIEYLVMEYVPGSSLRDTMSDEGFYPEEDRMEEWLDKYFMPLLEGVQALHEQGIVHRDLKPENVLLAGAIPKIADFGLARSCLLKPITQSMHILGTPPYMAQEQFMDLKRSDERADVYALGKILYEAAAGRTKPERIPFKQAGLNKPEGAFYQQLDRIIRMATAEDKNDRLASVAALKQALDGARSISHGPFPTAFPEPVKRFAGIGYQRKKAWLAGSAALLLAVGLVVVTLVREPDGERRAAPATTVSPAAPPKEQGLPAVIEAPPTSLKRELLGNDEAVLKLVPGGTSAYPGNFEDLRGKSIRLEPFYMDATSVTNHQFVQFPNAVADRVKVENGVVREGENIWLLLGEVAAGYEPIVFTGERFHVKTAHHAACPVLRVTAYGASAYAGYYGRRLPALAEWYHALAAGMGEADNEASYRAEANLPIPSPVMVYKPNRFGIRGLNANIGEWGTIKPAAPDELNGGQMQHVILGGIPKADRKEPVPAPVRRYPWEAFDKVGFRCVMDIEAKQ
jgi:serine/threonine-protein kinase